MSQGNKYFRIGYKALGALLIIYAIVAGVSRPIPVEHTESLLEQTWRNLFYHVPMWYVVLLLFIVSGVQSVMYLNKSNLSHDIKASASVGVGLLFGTLGLATGILWSRPTWGAGATGFTAWWSWDPKQTAILALMLIYLAYFLLRNSFNEPSDRARISAVYNVFGMAMIIPLYYIIPRIVGGLHPGSGDEGSLAALTSLDNATRMIFYPASIGFICLGFWIMELQVRRRTAEWKLNESDL